MEVNSKALEHFVKLARRGRYPAASGGERRSAELAKAILEQSAGLDSLALQGAGEFMQFAARYGYDAEELIG